MNESSNAEFKEIKKVSGYSKEAHEMADMLAKLFWQYINDGYLEKAKAAQPSERSCQPEPSYRFLKLRRTLKTNREEPQTKSS